MNSPLHLEQQKKMIEILELKSKMKEGKDFCVGYSPERINPEIKNVIEKINKIVYKNLSKKIL